MPFPFFICIYSSSVITVKNSHSGDDDNLEPCAKAAVCLRHLSLNYERQRQRN